MFKVFEGVFKAFWNAHSTVLSSNVFAFKKGLVKVVKVFSWKCRSTRSGNHESRFACQNLRVTSSSHFKCACSWVLVAFDLGSGPKTSPSQLAIHCFERRERLRGKTFLCCCHVLKAKNSSIIKTDIRSHILRKINFTKYKPIQKKSSHFKIKERLIEKLLSYERHPERKEYQRQRIVE